MEPELEMATDYTNYAFLAIFVLEMIIKLLGLGFKEYFIDGYNVFDCVIVMLSIVEIVVK